MKSVIHVSSTLFMETIGERGATLRMFREEGLEMHLTNLLLMRGLETDRERLEVIADLPFGIPIDLYLIEFI